MFNLQACCLAGLLFVHFSPMQTVPTHYCKLKFIVREEWIVIYLLVLRVKLYIYIRIHGISPEMPPFPPSTPCPPCHELGLWIMECFMLTIFLT